MAQDDKTAVPAADEMLEVWDWERAVPTGAAVPRREAHARGIPHEGVHLWVLRARECPEILFQHRAAHKEHYPDCLDITVGGHVPFGLKDHKVQKEAMEEIGLDPSDEDLVDLGLFRYEERSEGLFHREFQRVYLLRDDRPLERYTFTDGEVTGIYAVPLSEFQGLFTADREFPVRGFDGREMVTVTVSRRSFHPQLFDRSMEAYMDIFFRACRELTSRNTVTSKMPLLPAHEPPARH
ncbi:MAG: hypothetical protein JXA20_14935 [Spirochaetes bacterium]|nr:hypothetical protein [Spirochaetota bacterium]